MKKALIKTGYGCNNNCVFCHLGDKRNDNLTTKEVENKILFCKKQGYNFVVFSGGESTIRTDIIDIAKFVKKNEMNLGFITNGRMFSYYPFVEKLIQNNLKYVYVSLSGSNEKIHNSITNSQSFNQTVKGIENLAKYKSLELKLNITVISENIYDLKNMVDLAKNIGAKKIKFSSVDCKGNVLKDMKIVPKLSLTIEKIKEAVDYTIEKGMQPLVSDFPLCLIGEYSRYIDNLETNGIKVMSEVFEDKLFPIDFDDKVKSSVCAGCEKYKSCKGIDKEYLKRNGDGEIRDARKLNISKY